MLHVSCRVAVAAALLVGVAATAPANPHSARQYYGGWQKHPTATYHYRAYYYKPSPSYAGYKHHYVIYHPARPKHLYFYNPYKKVYWGRCPTDHGGKPVYSHLAAKDCHGDLDQIPEAVFPAPAGLPGVPEATDDAKLELPPDDLPPADAKGLPLK